MQLEKYLLLKYFGESSILFRKAVSKGEDLKFTEIPFKSQNEMESDFENMDFIAKITIKDTFHGFNIIMASRFRHYQFTGSESAYSVVFFPMMNRTNSNRRHVDMKFDSTWRHVDKKFF